MLDVKLIGNVFFVRKKMRDKQIRFIFIEFSFYSFWPGPALLPGPCHPKSRQPFFKKSDLAPLPLGPLKRTFGHLGNIQL